MTQDNISGVGHGGCEAWMSSRYVSKIELTESAVRLVLRYERKLQIVPDIHIFFKVSLIIPKSDVGQDHWSDGNSLLS